MLNLTMGYLMSNEVLPECFFKENVMNELLLTKNIDGIKLYINNKWNNLLKNINASNEEVDILECKYLKIDDNDLLIIKVKSKKDLSYYHIGIYYNKTLVNKRYFVSEPFYSVLRVSHSYSELTQDGDCYKFYRSRFSSTRNFISKIKRII